MGSFLSETKLRDYEDVKKEQADNELEYTSGDVRKVEALKARSSAAQVDWYLEAFLAPLCQQKPHLWVQHNEDGNFAPIIEAITHTARDLDPDISDLIRWTIDSIEHIENETFNNAIFMLWEYVHDRARAWQQNVVERWPDQHDPSTLSTPAPYVATHTTPIPVTSVSLVEHRETKDDTLVAYDEYRDVYGLAASIVWSLWKSGVSSHDLDSASSALNDSNTPRNEWIKSAAQYLTVSVTPEEFEHFGTSAFERALGAGPQKLPFILIGAAGSLPSWNSILESEYVVADIPVFEDIAMTKTEITQALRMDTDILIVPLSAFTPETENLLAQAALTGTSLITDGKNEVVEHVIQMSATRVIDATVIHPSV